MLIMTNNEQIKETVKAAVHAYTPPEKRSRRVCISVAPRTYRRASAAAKEAGTSLNDLINVALDAIAESYGIK